MFETGYASAGAASRRPWTFTLSLIGEVIFVAALALAPLLTTPEIAGAFEGAILLVAPPKPPAPRRPAEPAVSTAQAVPERFTAEISAPAVMPDHAARIIEDRAQLPTITSEPGPGQGVVGSVPWTGDFFAAQVPSVAPPPKPRPHSPRGLPDLPTRIQVGGAVQGAKLIRRVVPEYPPAARQVRVSGTVT